MGSYLSLQIGILFRRLELGFDEEEEAEEEGQEIEPAENRTCIFINAHTDSRLGVGNDTEDEETRKVIQLSICLEVQKNSCKDK